VKSLGLALFLLLNVSHTCRAEDLNTKGFKDNSEFGETIVSGNSNAQTYNAKQTSIYAWENDSLKLEGHYLESSANGVESALNWNALLKYVRTLSPLIAAYASYGVDSDIYAGFVQMNNSDLGGKYFLAKDPDFHWTVELGYRYSSTHYPAASQQDISTNSVRLYTEAIKTIDSSTSFKFWIEYIPTLYSPQNGIGNYQSSQDYILNAEPSISVMLNKLLSLKTSYLFKYRNYLPVTSVTTKYLDTFFITSIVAQY
jgi:putative salt-induced outer membrane protein